MNEVDSYVYPEFCHRLSVCLSVSFNRFHAPSSSCALFFISEPSNLQNTIHFTYQTEYAQYLKLRLPDNSKREKREAYEIVEGENHDHTRHI
jgi:hypothetical protein